MQVKVDGVGRVLIPKQFREEFGLLAGTTVDISRYGAGLQVLPAGRTASLVEEGGRLVATGGSSLSDDELFALIDAGRR